MLKSPAPALPWRNTDPSSAASVGSPDGAIAYAVAIVYVSLVLSAAGFHFAPLVLEVAWRKLLATPYRPHVFAVVYINDLLSPHWRTVPEALAAFDKFGLLFFYHHYIVSKAHAAESVAGHLLTFAPIGVMVALRRGSEGADVWTAAILAALFSLAVEVGRWFKPGLQLDFSDAVIAGGAVKLTPAFWSILESETIAAPRTPGGIALTFVQSQHGSPRIPDFGGMIRRVRR